MLTIFYNIFIFPIYLLLNLLLRFILPLVNYEILYTLIFLSIIVNLISLPLFLKAEKMQEENYKKTAKLQPQIKEIKETFKGNEQFYMLNTFFRQNKYYPFYSLKNLAMIILIVPFFFGAYKLLSGEDILNFNLWTLNNFYLFNVLHTFSFTEPDGLLVLFGFKINILPILMTAINILASFKYTKCNSTSDRIQLIITPLIFLVLLYNAPSLLVIYWIFNNIFSLFKNMLMDSPNFNKIINILKYAILFEILILVAFCKNFEIFVLIILSEIIFQTLKYLVKKSNQEYDKKFIDKTFILTCISYILIFGALIPTNIISSDVFSFSNCNIKDYLFNIFIVSIGIFGFWTTVIYFSTFSTNLKFIFTTIFSGVLFSSIYELFATNGNFGTLNTNFQLPTFLLCELKYPIKTLSLDIIIYLSIFIIIAILIKKQKNKIISTLLYAVIISSFLVSSFNYYKISRSIVKLKNTTLDKVFDFEIKLSKTKNNVIIIMLDRAVSIYLPHIFKDIPELKDSFNGFIYYPNTLSLGAQTIIAYPALIGGYDYVPKKYLQSMERNYNESLLVLPTLYKNNNYDLTLINMPWAGFNDIYDKDFYSNNGIYNDYNLFDTIYMKHIRKNKLSIKNSIYFTTVLILPKPLKQYFYKTFITEKPTSGDTIITKSSIEEFSIFTKKITGKSTKNCFVVINSMITHGELSNQDLEKYIDKKRLKENYYDGQEQKEYNANLLAIIKTSEFLKQLKSEGVYDNSRIIIVADHGSQFISDRKDKKDTDFQIDYNPLLMVKDIKKSEKIKISDEFMTNADVPYLATKGLVKQAKNPFTQNDFRKGKREETYYIRKTDNSKWSPSHFKKATPNIININQFIEFD